MHPDASQGSQGSTWGECRWSRGAIREIKGGFVPKNKLDYNVDDTWPIARSHCGMGGQGAREQGGCDKVKGKRVLGRV